MATACAVIAGIEAVPYELYIRPGNQSGSELDDWLQAEEEILQSQEQALAAKS
jgi:hypothetical protein